MKTDEFNRKLERQLMIEQVKLAVNAFAFVGAIWAVLWLVIVGVGAIVRAYQ